jgi:hypothetical protein
MYDFHPMRGVCVKKGGQEQVTKHGVLAGIAHLPYQKSEITFGNRKSCNRK